MSSLQWKAINSIGAVVGVALILSNLAVAQAQTIATQMDQPNRVSVAYVAPKDPVFQELYGLLRDRRALEKIQGILSPSARGADHQDGGTRRGKFLVHARKFQAHCDHLL
jgi:hypothetical protein